MVDHLVARQAIKGVISLQLVAGSWGLLESLDTLLVALLELLKLLRHILKDCLNGSLFDVVEAGPCLAFLSSLSIYLVHLEQGDR